MERSATINITAHNSASDVLQRITRDVRGLSRALDKLGKSQETVQHRSKGVGASLTGINKSLSGMERGLLGGAGGGGLAGAAGGAGGRGGTYFGGGAIGEFVGGVSEGGEVIEEFAEGLEALAGPLLPLKALFLGATVAVGAFGVALGVAGGLAAKSIGVYLEKTSEGEKAAKRLSKAQDELSASIGGSIIGYKQAGGLLDILAEKSERLAKFYRDELAASVFGFAKNLANSVLTLTAGAVNSVGSILIAGVGGLRHFMNVYMNSLATLLGGLRRLFGALRRGGEAIGLDVSQGRFEALDTFFGGEMRRLEQGAQAGYEKTSQWIAGIGELTRGANAQIAVLQGQIGALEMGEFKGLKTDKEKEDKKGLDALREAQQRIHQGIRAGRKEAADTPITVFKSDKGFGRLASKAARMKQDERFKPWFAAFEGKAMFGGLKGGIEWTLPKLDEMNKAFSNLANQGIRSSISAFGDFLKTLASGKATLGEALKAWVGQMGDIFYQTGLGYIFAGMGEIAIASGDPSGGIAAGGALVGVGLALSALQRIGGSGKKGKGGGGGVIGAINDAFSSAIDRILAENKRKETPIVNNFVIEGHRLDGPVADSLARLQLQGRLAARVVPG